MWRAVLVLLAVSAGLFAVLTVWTDHITAAGIERASAALVEPPNAHRAVARLRFHWRGIVSMLRAGLSTSSPGYGAELRQARLSAHLLNLTACGSIAPR